MKASNIFQKLKSAGVGNPDGVPSSKPKLNLGSPAKMAKSPNKLMGPVPTPKKKEQPKSSAPSAYEKALGNNPDLPNLIKQRKGLDKSSNAYKKIQNAINKAYGVSKRYELTPENNTPAKTPAKTPAADTPKIDKVNQAPKVQEAKTNVQEAKTNIKNVKAEVAETNRQARKTRRAENKAARIQKRADRKNARAERIKAEGGTRVGNFLRGKKKEESPAAMKKGSAMKMAKKKSPMKMAKKKSPMKMAEKSPNKFNAGLKKAAAAGKLDKNPKFKAAVENAPTKMMKKDSPAKAIPPALAAAGKKIVVDAIAKKASSAMKMKKGAAMKMKKDTAMKMKKGTAMKMKKGTAMKMKYKK
tara:strand:+ start:6611 stop:7681 length:1071 start_codon:yes stop_codon:yes gene_type:complete